MKRKHKDRKDRIEEVHVAARKLLDSPQTLAECLTAWTRLCRHLDAMTLPDARPPRFDGLLKAIQLAAEFNLDDEA